MMKVLVLYVIYQESVINEKKILLGEYESINHSI